MEGEIGRLPGRDFKRDRFARIFFFFHFLFLYMEKVFPGRFLPRAA